MCKKAKMRNYDPRTYMYICKKKLGKSEETVCDTAILTNES